MDLELSDSQILLVDSARALLAERCPLTIIQAMAAGAEPPPLWEEMARLGWCGLLVPEDCGGAGGTLLDAVLLVEQLGYACAPSPYVHGAVAAPALVCALDVAAGQRDELLGAIASGQVLALAVAEESGEHDPARLTLALDADRRLRGTKRFVKDADIAQALLVAARDADGVSVVTVPRSEVTIDLMPTLSGERLYEVSFDGVPAGDGRTLGTPGRAGDGLERALAAGAVARAAEMVGLAGRIVEIAAEYAKVREQSGQPIGAFQAIQHHCADMLRDLEGSRYMAYRAAWQLDQATSGSDSWRAEVAMSKAYASEACLAVARKAHQVMGAIGYCEEHPLHLLHKRIHAAALDFGDATSHLDTVASELGLAPAAARAATRRHNRDISGENP